MKPDRFSLGMIALAAVFLAACAVGTPNKPVTVTPGIPTASASATPADPGFRTPTLAATLPPFAGDVPVLVWHREGGIAGFCDDLSVHADGSFSATTCLALPESPRTGQLDAGQLAQLTQWIGRFVSFDISDGPGAPSPDAMILKTTFKGLGTADPGPEDIAQIDAFASSLVSPPVPVGSADQLQAVARAREFLAGELNISPDEVVVVSFEFVEWPDRCLGVTVRGQMCAMGVTPGYRIVMRAQGLSYEVHTDQTGESLRQLRQP